MDRVLEMEWGVFLEREWMEVLEMRLPWFSGEGICRDVVWVREDVDCE